MNKYIKLSKEVSDALKNNKPVVALESTIISHGMPYPDNVNMANKVEAIIRENGAVPATIAIMDGFIKVGLTSDEVKRIASEKNVIKVSKRDLGYALSTKTLGATTVSATMIAANLAGIRVFATGGIGGVHRGAETTFDISRDLEELADLNVAVVCAGAKSILDLGLTLEYLETKGVEVLGYKTDKLPAFYSSASNFDVLYRMDTPKDIAKLMDAKWSLGLSGGVLITNPIPEEHSLDFDKIEKIISDAVKEANENNILGKESTPFLLAKVKDLSEGKSLTANLELVYNNAKLAALVASEFVKL